MDITSLAWNSPSFILLTRRLLPSTTHNKIFLPQRHGSLCFKPISCSTTSSSNTNDDNDVDSVQAPTSTPPDAVGVRFRKRSRRRSRRQRDTNGTVSNSVQSTMSKGSENTPKKWEDMTLIEKAIELYVGEKGALFWLNKFAYASIFIIIGGWIAFRFVGPALNLYQLESSPLPPSEVFKGSS